VKNKCLGSSLSVIATSGALLLTPCVQATAASLTGSVLTAGQPAGGATVTLYAAGMGAPTQLARGRADDSGAFMLTYGEVGIGARGVSLDSKGNLWVASLMSPDFPMPKIPDGVSIMEPGRKCIARVHCRMQFGALAEMAVHAWRGDEQAEVTH
jgi:hypothetical protein